MRTRASGLRAAASIVERVCGAGSSERDLGSARRASSVESVSEQRRGVGSVRGGGVGRRYRVGGGTDDGLGSSRRRVARRDSVARGANNTCGHDWRRRVVARVSAALRASTTWNVRVSVVATVSDTGPAKTPQSGRGQSLDVLAFETRAKNAASAGIPKT